MSKVAVITGGAGGIGQALCQVLRDKAWYVVLIDLPSETLSALACDNTDVYACDLTDALATQSLCQSLIDKYPAIDLVIYNAGVTHIGLFAKSDLAAHKRVMEINYLTMLHVAKHLLPAVRAAKGVHLAMSSVAGFAPLVQRTAYSASKHAVEGFMKSLQVEEKAYGVACVIASPSFVATNLDKPHPNKEGLSRPGSASDGVDYMTPRKAAEAIIAGYEKRKPRILVGLVARLSWILARFAPRLYDTMMKKHIR